MSDQVNQIIAGIPNDQMEDGYRQQREALERNLALNAAAYRMQEGNSLLQGDARGEGANQYKSDDSLRAHGRRSGGRRRAHGESRASARREWPRDHHDV